MTDEEVLEELIFLAIRPFVHAQAHEECIVRRIFPEICLDDMPDELKRSILLDGPRELPLTEVLLNPQTLEDFKAWNENDP